MKEVPILRRIAGNNYWADSLRFRQIAIALVSDEDSGFAKRWRWGLDKDGYAKGSERGAGKSVNVFLHNEIAKRMGLVLKLGETVDHYPDRNKLNCQRNNLRAASWSMQNINRGLFRNSTSGEKGISWRKSIQKWQARIKFEGQEIHLGCFTNKQDAVQVRKKAELERDIVRGAL